MKKFCILLSCLLLLQLVCACSGDKEELQVPVKFYYANKEITYHSASGVLQAEVREGIGFQGDLAGFLHSYLRGPVSPELQSLIPSDVKLISCETLEETAAIVLSSGFSSLTDVKLTTACTGLLLSANEFAGIQTVRISAQDSLLAGKEEFTLTMDDIVLMDSTILAD